MSPLLWLLVIILILLLVQLGLGIWAIIQLGRVCRQGPQSASLAADPEPEAQSQDQAELPFYGYRTRS